MAAPLISQIENYVTGLDDFVGKSLANGKSSYTEVKQKLVVVELCKCQF